jgi:hypothetical protein
VRQANLSAVEQGRSIAVVMSLFDSSTQAGHFSKSEIALWVLKNAIFLKTTEKMGIENVRKREGRL